VLPGKANFVDLYWKYLLQSLPPRLTGQDPHTKDESEILQESASLQERRIEETVAGGCQVQAHAQDD